MADARRLSSPPVSLTQAVRLCAQGRSGIELVEMVCDDE